MNLINNVEVINMEGISGHSLVNCTLKIKKIKQPHIACAYVNTGTANLVKL